MRFSMKEPTMVGATNASLPPTDKANQTGWAILEVSTSHNEVLRSSILWGVCGARECGHRRLRPPGRDRKRP